MPKPTLFQYRYQCSPVRSAVRCEAAAELQLPSSGVPMPARPGGRLAGPLYYLVYSWNKHWYYHCIGVGMSLALVAVSAKYWRANDSGPRGVGHCDYNFKARDTPPRSHEMLREFSPCLCVQAARAAQYLSAGFAKRCQGNTHGAFS